MLKTLQYIQAYIQAIQDGVEKFAISAPYYVRQHINLETKRKLNTTANHYKDHVSVKMVDTVLVVELDRDDWLTNALESGVGQFDMKRGLLNSPKARRGKKGFKFIRVPLKGNRRPIDPEKSEKSQDFQAKLNKVLMKPKTGLSQLKILMDGRVAESQKIVTDDPQLQGFYRTRMFENANDYYSKKSKPQWEYVLFRTVSENPESKTGATWQHPGIKPVNIMRSTETWIEQTFPHLLDSFVEAEIKALDGRMKV